MVNLLDPSERKKYLDESMDVQDRISRGFEVPDFFIALGFNYSKFEQQMIKVGYRSVGGGTTTYDYMNPWKQLQDGVKFGEQSKVFESTFGRRRRYSIVIQPDMSVKWTCRNSGRWSYTWGPAIAEGTDIQSMIDHATVNPRKFGKDYRYLERTS